MGSPDGPVLLITGGAGFIGSALVRRALARPYARVVVVDKLTYAGNRSSLDGIDAAGRLHFVEADIADAPAMAALFRDHAPGAVMNLAAETHVDRSIDDLIPFVHTNVQGTCVLLNAARRYVATRDERSQAAFRFLHVSTDEVYGTLGADGLFHETTPYAPNSPYAASKASADHFVRAFHETWGLATIVTNCSNNYGPRQYPEKLIPLMLLNALEARDLPIYGDGGNVRDWLFVDDHCDGLLLALERGAPGRAYNIGGSNERTNLEVVDALCAALEARRPGARNPALSARGLASYSGLKTFVADRPGHDRRYGIDASRIRAELGWQPRFDFEGGLAQTVDWYLSHLDWCAHVQAGHYRRERLGAGAVAAS